MIAALAAALTLPACSRHANKTAAVATVDADIESASRPVEGEFSVMAYNLKRFCYDDRDGDGQVNDFKPDAEIQAELSAIQNASPDVLACMEMGDTNAFRRFQDELKARGLTYPHSELLVRPGTATHLALLSRFPIVSRTPITTETFSIGTNVVPVEHGFLCAEIKVNDHYHFKLVAAHLRSKQFAALGQTEMRRNEARLLNKNIRHILRDKSDGNLFVIADLNDTPKSAAVREAIGEPPVLRDLRPADIYGDVWTRAAGPDDSYDRTDYMLCNSNMTREAVAAKCHIMMSKFTALASDHRPLIAVFRSQDL